MKKQRAIFFLKFLIYYHVKLFNKNNIIFC